jgi:hypothetical protein
MIGQELERYITSQPDIFGVVDHAHASTTQVRDDSVMRDGTADHQFAGSIAQVDGKRAQALCRARVTASVLLLERCRIFPTIFELSVRRRPRLAWRLPDSSNFQFDGSDRVRRTARAW